MKWVIYSIQVSLICAVFLRCNTSTNNQSKKVFRYNESAGVNTLDPANARYLEDMRVIDQLYDGLLELDESLQIKPCIAESYFVSEDGLTYTFSLRDDVYFPAHELFKNSEKRKVTATDFLYSFQRILDPKVASPGMWIFNSVSKDIPPFEAVDENTFRVHLEKPFPAFLGILTMQYCNVVPSEIVSSSGNDFRKTPHGTGPFKLAFWLEGVSLVLHKNPTYFLKDSSGEQLPYLDAVRVDFVRDKSTVFLDFLKGKYDFISGLDASYKDELLTQNGELTEAYADKVNFQKVPFIKTDYIGLLVDSAKQLDSPLLIKEFRQALNFSVDRDKLSKYLRNNSVFPAKGGFLPKGFAAHGNHQHEGYYFDIEKAKDLMEASGVPRNMEITISTTSEYVDICEYLQHQWSELGLKVKVEALQSSNHRDLVANSEIEVFRKSWLADYTDEENFLGLFYSKNFSPGGPNYTHFSNSEFDRLFELALNTPDYEIRKNIYGAMDSLILEEAPVVPLFYDQVSHFLSKNIGGFKSNSVNMLDLKTVTKE